MKKKYKIPLIILVLLIIIISILFVSKLFPKKEEPIVKVVDSIDDFSYTLDERDSNLMKDTYNDLKKVLKEKDVDFSRYAECLAKLFVIDLFTIDNKINKYDVGGLEYVYPSAQDNFKTNVEDTLYRLIENNSNNKRHQDLPVVSAIETKDIKKDTYKIGDNQFDSFEVSLTWTYEEEDDYDTSATIYLVKEDDKVYVVEYNVGEKDE